jgi:predicted DNA-binding transcriptional regulator YafY
MAVLLFAVFPEARGHGGQFLAARYVILNVMSDTTGRLLSLLSLLQMPRTWPGDELARRLGVSRRTVRRDVERLRELGYPVRTAMGAGGGYRLVAGTAMPPLLLDDEEAVAIAAGLRTAAASAIEGVEDASVRALAKLEQVLPSRLRQRVTALSSVTVPPVPVPGGRTVDPAVLASVAAASAWGQRLRFGYVSAEGMVSRRLVEPCRLVTAGRRWYLVGYDNDQDDWRTFRVDRITEPHLTGQRFAARLPEDTDPAEFARGKLYSTTPVFRAEVTVHLADALVRELLPGWEPGEADGRLTSPPDTVPWLASRLLGLGCEFEVHAPPELIGYLTEVATRASRAAGSGA